METFLQGIIGCVPVCDSGKQWSWVFAERVKSNSIAIENDALLR